MKNLNDFCKTVGTAGMDLRRDTESQATDIEGRELQWRHLTILDPLWWRERVRLITLNKVDSVKLTLKAAREMTLAVVATTTTLFLKV